MEKLALEVDDTAIKDGSTLSRSSDGSMLKNYLFMISAVATISALLLSISVWILLQ